ncbi:hypothetical protein DPEC_G00298520 [Dallia pectoralis]|uniref:Uncharacterized protein n=1 Tax=Dallia pectoralis TaxID=75939 RepID=A0ACC2FFY6_DALPE|nr:hypothetical protein DPEC_G00298520 [Dallia pectoralis]
MDYLEVPEEELSENENEDDGEKGQDSGLDITDEGNDGETGAETKGDDELKRGWACLPDVCLRQVFSLLRDHDRVKAVLVCHNWHGVMHSPSLWRARSFILSGRVSRTRRSELEKAVCFAQTYGRYLETLEIRFSHPLNSLVTRRLQQTLRTFLTALRKTSGRLRCLTINHMELDRVTWCSSVRSALVCSLAYYLRREGSRLGHLSLRGARFNLAQGLEVLEAVAAAQQHVHLAPRPGITDLDLEDFFSQSLTVFSCLTFPKVMNCFRGLCTLRLNYSCISTELLEALAAGCRSVSGAGTLRTFSIRCHANEPHFQPVWGDAWFRLVRSCPELQVHVTVERILNVEVLGRILLREIPLRSFSLASCYFSEPDWSAKPFLTDLLPCYSGCLQRLSLDLNNSHEYVDEELLDVVLGCPRLIYLKVWAFLDISFLDMLLQKRLERQTTVQTIKVRIYTSKYETEEEDEKLEAVYSRYRQLIDSELHYYIATSYPML